MSVTESATTEDVDVYWRPGCQYCVTLWRAMGRRHIRARWHNIWAEEAALARVRSVTGGVDTVPTVFVGDAVLVNPAPGVLFALIADRAPQLLGDPQASTGWPPLRIAQWAVTGVLVAASLTLDRTGHTVASWGVDPVAVLAWFGLGWARRQRRTGSQ
ncbi:MAG: glutaredoxin family protein [Acidimicrobiales bacterium]